jgi:hypothetical protein
VRPAVALGDAEVEVELRRRPGDHRRAAVGVRGELLGDDALVPATRRDELLRGGCGLALGDLPADDVAAEDVEDDLQRVVRAPGGARSLVYAG